jgi:hypothetical protein
MLNTGEANNKTPTSPTATKTNFQSESLIIITL